ncbi:gag-pol polyprotein, partial [Trifolium medium]|nr:gag-pol polyprotein [Trifolium medium]
MDYRAWKAIIKGWNYPVITAENGTTTPKPEAEWTTAEDTEATGNSKALNAIFNGV